jgi:hypothetical protein
LSWVHCHLFEAKGNQLLALFLVFVSICEVLMFRTFLRFYKESKRKK